MKLNKKQMKRPLILSYLIVVGLSIIISMQMTSQVNYLIKLGYSKNESKKIS